MKRGLLASVLALVLVVAGGVPTTYAAARHSAAPEAEAHVEARENYFYPSTVTVRRGGAVVWDWTGQATHNAVDATGMGLFDSGLTPPGGESFSYTFSSSGSYRYVCTLHDGMAGRVEVPVRAVASAGGVRVVWSANVAPDGFVFDVQVRRPGHLWRQWLDGTSDLRGTYEAGSGALRFRARLRLAPTGTSSDWSEAAKVRLG